MSTETVEMKFYSVTFVTTPHRHADNEADRGLHLSMLLRAAGTLTAIFLVSFPPILFHVVSKLK